MALDIDRLAGELVRGAELLVARAVERLTEDNASLRRECKALAARLAEVEARAPVPGKDGKDGADGHHGKDGRDGVDGRDGRDGKDADPEEIARLVASAVAALPPAPPGRDGIDGKDGRDGKDGVDGKDGLDGKDGRDGLDGKDALLPVVKAWSDRVHYAGECVTRDGATWQARCDTGRAPPHEDWICLAAPGRDGRSFAVRGTFDPAATYSAFDVVALNGGSFVARHDCPGDCPGDGWQLLASRGKPGMKGDKGDRGDRGVSGDRGVAGPALIGATVSSDGVLTLVRDDGAQIEADFYDVLGRLK